VSSSTLMSRSQVVAAGTSPPLAQDPRVDETRMVEIILDWLKRPMRMSSWRRRCLSRRLLNCLTPFSCYRATSTTLSLPSISSAVPPAHQEKGVFLEHLQSIPRALIDHF